MAPSNERYSVSWAQHANNFSDSFYDLLEQKQLVDVTLAADGHLFPAHRLVLSALSPYFHGMFAEMPVQQQAIVFMADASKQTIEDLITFIYCGEVNVEQDNLQDFLKTANALQIKGLLNGYGECHSQTPTSNFSRSQYQSSRTSRINGSVSAIEFEAPTATAPTNFNQFWTHYRNQKEDKLDFGGYVDSYSMVDHSDGNFDGDNDTEVPAMDYKAYVSPEKWIDDIETGSANAQMDKGAPKAKRAKGNKDLSDYKIVADIRANADGKQNLFHESFKFGKHSKNDLAFTRWTCTKHSRDKCRAVMSTTIINGVCMMKVIRAEHTHQPE